jgi:Carbon-nitrogen hydrolase
VKLKIFLLSLAILFIAYGFWRGNVGINYDDKYTPIDSAVISFEANSSLHDKGNLVGVQPYMEAKDYSSQEAFQAAMKNYLFDASAKQFLNPKSIVIFPEYIGTWLVAMDEKPSVYSADTVNEAMFWIVLRHPMDFISYYRIAKGKAPQTEAIFQLKAKEMAQAYYKTFSQLASKYEVTIVAGSILLPEPFADEKGVLQVKPGGNLYNITAVFNPDGSMNPSLVRKIYPIEEEKGFVCGADANALPVFDTPAGKLGVLVCADAWYPEPYKILKEKGAQLLAVPSYAAGDNIWGKLWSGYNGAPMPDDVDKTDVGKITEREAWKKYTMGGRAAAANIKYGVNVFLRGKLWDLGSDGETIVFGEGNLVMGEEKDGAGISCVWLR